MKATIILSLFLLSSAALAAEKPARKARVDCDFKRSIGHTGRAGDFPWAGSDKTGKLSYAINLNSRDVVVSCAGNDDCVLDGHSIHQTLTTRIAADASFSESRIRMGRVFTRGMNLPALNIEGGNGDDMEMFTRISFASGQNGTIATAVLIIADEGNDGDVTAPTDCSVEIL